MKNILLLSDTHSYMDERILDYAKNADEIWHAGDFGSAEVVDVLEKTRIKLRGVYGNIDGTEIRQKFPETLRFSCEGVEVLMKHIGGYPNKYDPSIRKEIETHPPRLFISGHSHILKAMYDENLQLLHLNPGACGNIGWHKVRTMMRFQINGTEIKNLEVIELGNK